MFHRRCLWNMCITLVTKYRLAAKKKLNTKKEKQTNKETK